jgi:very-short-patch-repair endonuclease
VNKYYPAIYYPPLILKFLVKNPMPGFKEYSNQAVKLSNQTTNRVNYDFTKLSNNIIYIVLIASILLSAFTLSPLWLVVVIWASIGNGIFCFISNYDNKKTNINTSNPRQCQPKLESKTRQQPPTRELSLQRQAKLHRWLQGKILQPSGKSEAPAGISEKAFYQIMKRIFPSIVQGVAFQNPKFPHPYSADFVLVHSSGLSIDIEIDEPYVGNTKAPHHCIDQGKDDIRNQFFTNNNWVVIRFSEKQVVKYPYSCCKVIAEVLVRVTGDRTRGSQLQNIPNLPPEPMWTTKQAKVMAKLDYRKTYLPVYKK